MSFLPVAILAYIFDAGSIIVNKIQLSTSLPNPLVYVFYVNVLGLITLFLIPLGLKLNSQILISGILAGGLFVLALYYLFRALKVGEASVVGPTVGALNPLFSLTISIFLLGEIFTSTKLMGFLWVLVGAIILTFSLWFKKLRLNQQLIFMILSGLSFAISYLFLRQTFLLSNFVSGLVVWRVSAGIIVLCFLFFPSLKKQVFSSRVSSHNFINKTTLLLLAGQIMGALSGLLISFGITLASPALVNSLFGVQYLIILVAALILSKKYANLLDENLTKSALVQKAIGAGILSWGVYLLSQ